MRFIKLGNTDLNLSQIGIGGMSFGSAGWMVGIDKAKEIIKRAVNIGINYIDTANIYSNGESETIIGKITEEMKEDLLISTKVGGKVSDSHSGFSRKELEYQLKQSMRRLRTDSIDIYFLHTWFDSLNPSEIIDTLNNMVRNGSISYYGLSNISGYQLATLDTMAFERDKERPQIVQNHYNPIYKEDERDVIPYCRLRSISYSPFSPLAAGFLTGKYQRGNEPETVRSKEYPVMKQRYFHNNDFDVLDSIVELSQELGVTSAAVSIAYLLYKKFIPVIGVSNPEYLADVESAFELTLRKDHIDRIDKNYLPHSIAKGTAGY